MPHYREMLEGIAREVQPFFGKGKVATYIPALARVSPAKLGIALRTVGNETSEVGDAAELFSIQSISKVFTLTLAIQFIGEKLWKRVGREPSGNPFNSLVQLEYENGIPRNPFINAGALVVTDVICSHTDEPVQYLLDFIRGVSGNPDIDIDHEVLESEKAHRERNAALAWFLKSYGNLQNDVDLVLHTYFSHCSIAMSAVQLSSAFLYLANGGKLPGRNEPLLTPSQTKRINALMLTAGMYDAVGEFAFCVGLPAKSGVGGGIVAVVPSELVITVWSPELNRSGNSYVGTNVLDLFTTRTGLSIF